MGEVAVEQQELKNTVGAQICCIDLAVGFECGAAPEQPDKFQVLIAGILAFGCVEKVRLIDLEQRSNGG
jgi:hypothetical protein